MKKFILGSLVYIIPVFGMEQDGIFKNNNDKGIKTDRYFSQDDSVPCSLTFPHEKHTCNKKRRFFDSSALCKDNSNNMERATDTSDDLSYPYQFNINQVYHNPPVPYNFPPEWPLNHNNHSQSLLASGVSSTNRVKDGVPLPLDKLPKNFSMNDLSPSAPDTLPLSKNELSSQQPSEFFKKKEDFTISPLVFPSEKKLSNTLDPSVFNESSITTSNFCKKCTKYLLHETENKKCTKSEGMALQNEDYNSENSSSSDETFVGWDYSRY